MKKQAYLYYKKYIFFYIENSLSEAILYESFTKL